MVGDLTARLCSFKGVHWAEVNAVTRHVLLAFDEDDVDLDEILEGIEEVERAHGVAEESFETATPEQSADDAPVVMAATALCADLACPGVAAAATVAGVRLLPRYARIPLLSARAHSRWVRFLLSELSDRDHAAGAYSRR